MNWKDSTLRSILVNDEDEKSITIRAAFNGSILKGIRFLIGVWCRKWFPYRVYPFVIEDGEALTTKAVWRKPEVLRRRAGR